MPTTAASTQQHVNIAQIKDGVVITRAGDLRIIVEVTPVNFALRSEEDQNVLIGQYQSFINSLTFPVQILVQSRPLDLHPYLRQLEQLTDQQPNELLALQATEYIEFIKRLTDLVNIMDKKFYLVVPFVPPPTQKVKGLRGLLSQKATTVSFSPARLIEYKNLLDQRVTTVETGLNSIGLKTNRLNTHQLIELYYYVYNPEESTEERLADEVEDIKAPIIQRAAQQAEQVVSQTQANPPTPPLVTQTNPPAPPPEPTGQANPSTPAATATAKPTNFGQPIENRATILNQPTAPPPTHQV